MADAFQPIIVNGITEIGGHLDAMSISDVLLAPKAAYDLDFDDSSREILLDFREPSLVLKATASDCCRLSSSAFQTVASLSEDSFEKSALPWALIKLYYSAFYAGHTLIRLLGAGCSFLDARHTARIDTFAKAIGKNAGFKIDAGLYRCVINPSVTKIACVKMTGSTHESFWRLFGDQMNAAMEGILRGPLTAADSQRVFNQLESLSQIAARYGSYNWLSTVRNGIQYRDTYKVWYPCKVRRSDIGRLSRAASQWKRDPMTIDLVASNLGIVGDFVVACAFIVAMCRVILVRLSELSFSKRSFLHYGPLAFIEPS